MYVNCGAWTPFHVSTIRRAVEARAFHGRNSATGPNPTDGGKPGNKRHLAVNAGGTPLGLSLTGENRHDGVMTAPTPDAIPPVRTLRRLR